MSVMAEERRRDRLAGVFGLALAGATAATLVIGPLGAHPRVSAPAPAPATVTQAHDWPPNPVELGAHLLRHIAKP